MNYKSNVIPKKPNNEKPKLDYACPNCEQKVWVGFDPG